MNEYDEAERRLSTDGKLRHFETATANYSVPSPEELEHFHQLIATAQKIDIRTLPEPATASADKQRGIGERLLRSGNKKRQQEGSKKEPLEQRLTRLLDKKGKGK